MMTREELSEYFWAMCKECDYATVIHDAIMVEYDRLTTWRTGKPEVDGDYLVRFNYEGSIEHHVDLFAHDMWFEADDEESNFEWRKIPGVTYEEMKDVS